MTTSLIVLEGFSVFHTLCRSIGETPTAMALAWLLHQPGVTSAIIGPGSQAQLLSVLYGPRLRLGEDFFTAINAIFPAVLRAPEAYAW